jgi:hypothetical protein
MLIEEAEKKLGRPAWNFSGFGSNDPGRNRENQEPAKFDTDYPVDVDRPIDFMKPGNHKLLDVISQLKSGLPYLFRYDRRPKLPIGSPGHGGWERDNSDGKRYYPHGDRENHGKSSA